MNELTRDKYLNDEELRNLNNTLQRNKDSDVRNCALLELMLVSGGRCAEILSLTRSDLNLVEVSVYLRGKKRSRDREIPIQGQLIDRLASLCEVGRLFPIGYHQLRNIWDLYRPAKKSLHSIRHTAALNLYRKTKDIKLVQTFLGHRSMTNTEIYLSFVSSQEDLRRALVG